MPLSEDILSFDIRKINEVILQFFDDSVLPVDEKSVARNLMHRIANYILIANNNKAQKREGQTPLSQLIQEAANPEVLAQSLSEHVFTPALTAHPTNPKSIETDEMLFDIYNLFMLIRNEMAAGERDDELQAKKNAAITAKLQDLIERRNFDQLPALGGDVKANRVFLLQRAEAMLQECCKILSKMPLQPDKKLEVPQEVSRNLEIFGIMFGEFNKFKNRVINEYCKTHNILEEQRVEIAKILTPAIAKQFQEIHFWSASDADGNPKITADTMLKAVHAHQKFLDELYLKQIESIKSLFTGHDIVLRELFAIKEIVEGVEIAEAAGAVEQTKDSALIVGKIDALIYKATQGDQTLNPEQQRALQDLRDSFDCFGFVGPKMDVRQSSFRNAVAMNQILQFLREKSKVDVSRFPSQYQELHPDLQRDFCNLLKTELVLEILSQEATLDAITALATEKAGDNQVLLAQANIAQEEISRMIVAKKYSDIFHRYIISDNKGIQSWNEVRALEAIAYKTVNPTSRIPDSKPLQVYPLCETREDIDNLPEMIRRLLENPEDVKTLHGRLDLFIGYSDAEKRAGIGALPLLQLRVFEAIKTINGYNLQHPESQIKVEIFHGRGNDLIRGGDKLSKLTTDQGQGAVDFGFKQRIKTSLEGVSGHQDEAELQIEQWRNLLALETDLATQIIRISTAAFEEFVSHGKGVEQGVKHGDKLATFLLDASMSSALAATNQSSRKKAKGAGEVAALNLDSERAIGLATRFSACGIHANLYYGMAQVLPEGNLPKLFENLTVFQDVVYKTLYALAITDFSRAEKIAAINQKELEPEMLQELRDSAFDALKNCIKFLPLDQARAEELLGQVDSLRESSQDFSIAQLTQRIMMQLPEFPLIKQLLSSAQDNQENYQNVIHAKLDEYLTANPESRAKLDSDLAILFREEMRIPNEINSLTTKTKSIDKMAIANSNVARFSQVAEVNSAIMY